MNKTGAEKISAEAIIGVVIGGILLVLLFTIVSPYITQLWDLFSSSKFDSQTLNSFDSLVPVLNELKNKETKIIPIWIGKDAALLAFNMNTMDIGGIKKPCSDSCLCLCSSKDNSLDKCLSSNCKNTPIIKETIIIGQGRWYNLKLIKNEEIILEVLNE